MGRERTRRQARSWTGGVLQVATLIALVVASGAARADQTDASAATRAGAAQSKSDDPCGYVTAEAMGRAFGRAMKSSTLANVCQYRGTDSGLVVVKVETGSEGTILRHVRAAVAQNQKGTEKVTSAVGEAYFDAVFPVFVGRVGNHEVQIETTITPLPRDAMIAVGTRIMETLARK